MEMINVYICNKEVWDSEDTPKPKCPVHYFPETLYFYDYWCDFYEGLSVGFHCIVSQHAELIKYLSVTETPYKVYIWEGVWVLHENLDEVKEKLLSCYGRLIFKEPLFKD